MILIKKMRLEAMNQYKRDKFYKVRKLETGKFEYLGRVTDPENLKKGELDD